MNTVEQEVELQERIREEAEAIAKEFFDDLERMSMTRATLISLLRIAGLHAAKFQREARNGQN